MADLSVVKSEPLPPLSVVKSEPLPVPIGEQPASLSGVAEVMGDQAKRAVGAAWDTISSAPGIVLHPLDAAQKAFGYTSDAIGRVRAAASTGDKKEAALSAVGAVPLAGPAAEQILREIDEGKYPEAIGHAAALRILSEAPGAIERLPKAAGKAVNAAVAAGGKDVVQGGLKAGVGLALTQLGPVGEIGNAILGAKPLSRGFDQVGAGLEKGWKAGRAAIAPVDRFARLREPPPGPPVPLPPEAAPVTSPPAAAPIAAASPEAAVVDPIQEAVAKSLFGKSYSKLSGAEKEITAKFKPRASAPAPAAAAPQPAAPPEPVIPAQSAPAPAAAPEVTTIPPAKAEVDPQVFETAGRAKKATTLAQVLHDGQVPSADAAKLPFDDPFWKAAAEKAGVKAPSRKSVIETLFQLRKLEAAKAASTIPQPSPELLNRLSNPRALAAAQALQEALGGN